MSKKKDPLTNVWLTKVPKTLLEAAEKKRALMGHNKTRANEYALSLYLLAPVPPAPEGVTLGD